MPLRPGQTPTGTSLDSSVSRQTGGDSAARADRTAVTLPYWTPSATVTPSVTGQSKGATQVENLSIREDSQLRLLS